MSVCNGEAVRKILSAPLDKGNWYRVFSMPDASFPNQMSQLSAAKHIALQRKIARGYAMSSIVKMEDRFDAAIQLFERGIEDAAAHDANGCVNLSDWCTFYAMDAVGLATFSKEFGFLRTRTDVGNSMAKMGPLKMYLALMAHFPDVHETLMPIITPLLIRVGMAPTNHVLQSTEAAIRAREGDDDASNDMFAHWKHQKAEDPISWRDLFATANANIAAGGDTVGTAEQAFVYYMLKHPDCVARLRAELDEASRQGRVAVPVQYQAAQQLPYLQACVRRHRTRRA